MNDCSQQVLHNNKKVKLIGHVDTLMRNHINWKNMILFWKQNLVIQDVWNQQMVDFNWNNKIQNFFFVCEYVDSYIICVYVDMYVTCKIGV